jgi:hypothetical protein
MRVLIEEGIVRKGRPYNLVIRGRILKIMEELPIVTPQRVMERYEFDYGIRLSWNTVSNRLTELLKENKIFMVETTPRGSIKGRIRTRINKIYSLKPLK